MRPRSTPNLQRQLRSCVAHFLTRVFRAKTYGPVRWLDGGRSYTTLEPSAKSEAVLELVRYDASTGQREVLITDQELDRALARKTPIHIEDYAWSSDFNRVLHLHQFKAGLAEKTRAEIIGCSIGKSGTLRKLGDGGPPSTLMFAKFSPDGSKVAYVRFNNIYVEDLESGEIARLTADGSEKIINGTSDWVYEEEFDLRDAFRWSPDGKRIAYWQFDTSQVKTFALIHDSGAPHQGGDEYSLSGVWGLSYGPADSLPRAGNSEFFGSHRGSSVRWRWKLDGCKFRDTQTTTILRAWSGREILIRSFSST